MSEGLTINFSAKSHVEGSAKCGNGQFKILNQLAQFVEIALRHVERINMEGGEWIKWVHCMQLLDLNPRSDARDFPVVAGLPLGLGAAIKATLNDDIGGIVRIARLAPRLAIISHSGRNKGEIRQSGYLAMALNARQAR